MTSDAWGDMGSEWEPSPCTVCDKPTKSHMVFLVDTGTRFEAGSPDDFDIRFAVCHSCYEDVDGDAGKLAGRLTEDRTPLLDEAGITPQMVTEMRDLSDLKPKRRKALGDAPVEEMIDQLRPGDVVELNDDRTWIIVPVNPETEEKINRDLVHTIMEVSLDGSETTSGAGAIVRSEHEFNQRYYHADWDEEHGLEFHEIEAVEVIGRKEDVPEVDPDVSSS